MVIRKPKSLGGKPHEVYLLEALSPKVLMDPLNLVMDWVIGDDGEGVMYWRPIMHPGEKSDRYPHGKISEEMEEFLWNEAAKNKGKPYQRNVGGMVEQIFYQDADCWAGLCGDCCCNTRGLAYDKAKVDEDSKEVFCSELVALMLINSGILDGITNTETFMPKDLSYDPHSKTKMGSNFWNEGFNAGKELKITKGDTMANYVAEKGPKKERVTTNIV